MDLKATLLAIHEEELDKIAERGDVVTLLTLAIQAYQAGLLWEAIAFARTAARVIRPWNWPSLTAPSRGS